MQDPFADHPEPELVDLRDEVVSRPRPTAGKYIDEALRYLYEEAMEPPLRSMAYLEMRRAFYGPSGGPAPAPATAAKADEVLGEFREASPYVFNTQHPGSYSYFTPPPLTMSIAGEVLGQWVNQGVDVGSPARWARWSRRRSRRGWDADRVRRGVARCLRRAA